MPDTPAFEDDDPSSVPEGTGDTWAPPLRTPVPSRTIETVRDLLAALQGWPLDAEVHVHLDIGDHDTFFRVIDLRGVAAARSYPHDSVVIEAA